MRVTAPVPFRYPAGPTGIDYPYGLQDIADDTLARTLIAAGYLAAPDDPLAAKIQSSVSGGVSGTVPSSQIIAGTLGSYTADTTYLTADTAGGVDKGTLVRWSSELAAWVFDFYRSATVI